MSETGIKLMIILAAIVIAIGSRFIPNDKDKQLIEKTAEEIIKEEVEQI